MVLGTVVNQQQNLRGGDRIGEQIEQRLGFFIDPVQVLENYNQRLVEALAHEDSLDRLQRTPLADLRIHLRKRIVLVD